MDWSKPPCLLLMANRWVLRFLCCVETASACVRCTQTAFVVRACFALPRFDLVLVLIINSIISPRGDIYFIWIFCLRICMWCRCHFFHACLGEHEMWTLLCVTRIFIISVLSVVRCFLFHSHILRHYFYFGYHFPSYMHIGPGCECCSTSSPATQRSSSIRSRQ